jgi:hypothetical protein
MYILEQEKRAEELIASGEAEEAFKLCEVIAAYWYDEEKNCDQAGEYSEGSRAGRRGDGWRKRAADLRRSLASLTTDENQQ